jgi:hypothetical protein
MLVSQSDQSPDDTQRIFQLVPQNSMSQLGNEQIPASNF